MRKHRAFLMLKKEAYILCSHEWLKVNDVWVCLRCGITRLPEGDVMFDRRLPNYKPKKKKARKKKK